MFAVLMVCAATATATPTTTTRVISDDSTGGDCTSIGTWDWGTKTCTVTADFDVVTGDGIQVTGDGITVDGNGHAVTGANDPSYAGIRIIDRTNITVTGLHLSSFYKGVVLENSSGNVICQNTLSLIDTAVFLQGSDNNRIAGNNLDSGAMAIWLNNSGNNAIDGNTITNYSMISFYLSNAAGNVIYGNDSQTWTYQLLFSASNNNQVYWNNFTGGSYVQITPDSTGNSFNLPYPDGGNYWSSWTSPDSNGDGFVDSPFVFLQGGQDDLPWAIPNGWWCGVKPAATLTMEAVYWASLSDFNDGIVSVDYSVNVITEPTAYNVNIVGTTNTNGVTLVTPVPVVLGDVKACCGGASATLKYHVPAGVQMFRNTVQATAMDVCGNGYSYP